MVCERRISFQTEKFSRHGSNNDQTTVLIAESKKSSEVEKRTWSKVPISKCRTTAVIRSFYIQGMLRVSYCRQKQTHYIETKANYRRILSRKEKLMQRACRCACYSALRESWFRAGSEQQQQAGRRGGQQQLSDRQLLQAGYLACSAGRPGTLWACGPARERSRWRRRRWASRCPSVRSAPAPPGRCARRPAPAAAACRANSGRTTRLGRAGTDGRGVRRQRSRGESGGGSLRESRGREGAEGVEDGPGVGEGPGVGGPKGVEEVPGITGQGGPWSRWQPRSWEGSSQESGRDPEESGRVQGGRPDHSHTAVRRPPAPPKQRQQITPKCHVLALCTLDTEPSTEQSPPPKSRPVMSAAELLVHIRRSKATP